MNETKVREEIGKISTSLRAKGWKFTKTTKKAMAKLEALGLTEYVTPRDLCAAEIVNAIVSAATDAGGKKMTESGFTVYGDGEAFDYYSDPSALYLALNEAEETEPTASDPDGGKNDDDDPLIKALCDKLARAREQEKETPGDIVRETDTNGNTWRVSYHVGYRTFRAYDSQEGQPLPAGGSDRKSGVRKLLGDDPDKYRVCECHVFGYTSWVMGSEWLAANPA